MLLIVHFALFMLALLNFGRAFFGLKDPLLTVIWLSLATLALIQTARKYRTLQR